MTGVAHSLACQPPHILSLRPFRHKRPHDVLPMTVLPMTVLPIKYIEFRVHGLYNLYSLSFRCAWWLTPMRVSSLARCHLPSTISTSSLLPHPNVSAVVARHNTAEGRLNNGQSRDSIFVCLHQHVCRRRTGMVCK